jgi:hypothetical protein
MTTAATTTTNHEQFFLVQMTEDQVTNLTYFLADYANDYGTQEIHGALSEQIGEAQPLDLEALRLVLDAAENEREYLDEMANHPDCSDDGKVRAKADALGDAIAKLESLTK